MKSFSEYFSYYLSAWCAGPEFSLGTQYLQVDFNESVLVSAVATQGDATDNNWINRYLVHYSWNGSYWIVATDSEGKFKVGTPLMKRIVQVSMMIWGNN